MPWDPFTRLASEAARLMVDGWIAMWLSLWTAGLWVLRLVLGWMDFWLTPDLAADGPGRELYQVTFWIAGVLVVILGLVQVGVAAGKRDGKALARAGIGLAQFAVFTGGWVAYTTAITAAAGGLTRACMESLMGVTSWRAWQPWEAFDPKSVTEANIATVLGFLGLFMWIAAIGHLLVLLARDIALLVLVGTGPIAAAGLANESTRSWFWKMFRWFHAAAFTPLLVVIVTGVGMKFAEGVTVGKAGTMEAAIGTVLPGVVLICVAVVSPVALFKLLAFVDPGTSSGASMRAGMQSFGGIQGVLRGGGVGGDTATAQSPSGSSAGEASADAATTSRVAGLVQAGSGLLGPVGAAFAAGIGAVTAVGSTGAALFTDVANQAGIGHNTYQPDYQAGRRDGAARAAWEQEGAEDDPIDDGSLDGPTPVGGPDPSGPTQPLPTTPSGGSPSAAAGESGTGGSAAGAETAAAVAL